MGGTGGRLWQLSGAVWAGIVSDAVGTTAVPELAEGTLKLFGPLSDCAEVDPLLRDGSVGRSVGVSTMPELIRRSRAVDAGCVSDEADEGAIVTCSTVVENTVVTALTVESTVVTILMVEFCQ